MILGVFCRSMHPAGYGGFPDRPAKYPVDDDLTPSEHGEGRGAHGYVTLIVTCADWAELQKVTARLQRYFQWAERRDDWYSGTFDLVWSAPCLLGGLDPGESYARSLHPETGEPVISGKRGDWVSIGDNRAVAYLSALDVLVG